MADLKSHEIAIHKLGGFFVTDTYAEGYTVNAEEAAALNQTKRENLRNNFAKTVATAQEKAKAEGRELSDEEKSALVASFSEYAASYTFAAKREPKAPIDPVQREAHKIATSMVTEALVKKGKKKSTLAEGQFDKLVDEIIAKNINGVVDEAKRRVESTKAVAGEALGDLLGDLGA
jgi:hypothetical protein